MKHKTTIYIDYMEARYISCLGQECDHKHPLTWSADAICSCGFFRSHIPEKIDHYDYFSEELLKTYRKRAISIFRNHHKKYAGVKWDSVKVEEDKSQLGFLKKTKKQEKQEKEGE